MTITSTAGIAASWAATRQDSAQQAMELAMVKTQAKADQALVAMIDETVRESAPPPAPPGQGLYVDKQA